MRELDILIIVSLALMAVVWLAVFFNIGGIVHTISAIFHWVEELRGTSTE